MGKKIVSVSIEKEMLDWIDQKVKEDEFASLAHAVRLALSRLRESMSEGE